jgi:hypothetical protein
MDNQLIKLFFCLSFSIILTSCSLFDNEDPKVAFIQIDKPVMTLDAAKEGASTHNIKHAWAAIDNKLIGVFPIPGSVPAIIKNEQTNIQVNWGVNDSGDNDSSAEYPFFNPVTIDVPLTSNQIIKFPSNVTYVKSAKFDVVEGFEQNFHNFTKDLDGNSNSNLVLSSKDKFTGQKSGLLVTNADAKIIEVTSGNYFSADNNKKGAIWLEFDYKSDETLFVGYDIATSSSLVTEYKVGLRPTKNWNRAYINFTEELSDLRVKEYRVAFKVAFTAPGGNLSSETFLDNIKLIHF